MDTEVSIEATPRLPPRDECDQVLDAIKAGNASLPDLKTATGINYSRLHAVLHYLEFDALKIRRTETEVGGFDRYELHKSEKRKPVTDYGVNVLRSNKTTPISLKANQLTIEQRDAPFCAKCRVEMFAYGLVKGSRRKWKCPKCKDVDDGSRSVNGGPMAHIDSHEAADEKIAEMIKRGSAMDPRTEAQIQSSPRTESEDLCGCGRARSHIGRCSARRQKEKEIREHISNPDVQGMIDDFARADVMVHEEGDMEKYLAMDEESPAVDTPERAPFVRFEVTPEPPAEDKFDLVLPEPVPAQVRQIIAAAPEQIAPIVIDGRLRMNIALNIDTAEMAGWASYRIANFWDGVAKVLKAVNDK